MSIAKLTIEDDGQGGVSIRTEFDGPRGEYSRALELAVLIAQALEVIETSNTKVIKKPRAHLPH